MAKHSTYQEKFSILKNWLPAIMDVVRRDLRNDHLNRDLAFAKRYFPGKKTAKLTGDELAQGYACALADSENGDAVGEFIANRWLIKNSDLYDYFAKELAKINPDFSLIEEVDDHRAHELVEGALKDFDLATVYLFALLNSVAFTPRFFEELGQRASAAAAVQKELAEVADRERSIENLVRDHKAQTARLIDKYEKRLNGLEAKYHRDVEALKKQIARLQKQQAL